MGSDATTGSTIVEFGTAHAEIVRALQIKRIVPSFRIVYIHLYFSDSRFLTTMSNQRNSTKF